MAPSTPTPASGLSQYLSTSREVLREQWPLILANTLEWYDAAVYGYVATYLESNFFPSGFSIGVWLGYASTFILRPAGGVTFGRLADKYMTRGQASLLAITAMTVATALQGCLPGEICCGTTVARISLVFLILFRAVQGLSSGGEIAAVAVYLAEKSPLTALGLSTGIVSLGGNMGFCLGAGSNVIIQAVLSKNAMERWGWRIPFLLVGPVGALILVKLRAKVLHTDPKLDAMEVENGSETERSQNISTDETSQLLAPPTVHKDDASLSQSYMEDDAQDKIPNTRKETTWQLVSQFRLQLVLGAAALAGISSHWYVAGVYIETFLDKRCDISQGNASTAAFLVQATALVFVPFAAYLTDSIGVGKVMSLGSGLITCLDWLIISSLASWFKGNSAMAFLGATLLGIIQAIAGTTPYLLILELFPPRSRSLGLGFSYNAGVAIFGGLGTVAASALVGSGFPSWTVGLLVSACGLMSFLAISAMRYMHANGQFQAAYIRPQLY